MNPHQAQFMHTIQKLFTLSALAFSAAGAYAIPTSEIVQVTVRDFSTRSFTAFYNPNFEKPGAISGLERGIVQTPLFAKVPTFNNPPAVALPGGGTSSVTTPGDFNQWWSPTVDGSPNNAPFNVSLTATLSSTMTIGSPGDPNYGVLGTYTFESSQFFPIDGAGSGGGLLSQATGGYYGNEATGHNYGFTMTYNTKLVYQPGTALHFFGDDDLWVFVDNKLVLDLGGTHPLIAGDFALTALSTDVDGNLLGLTPGDTYDLDIYFAERHTGDSDLKFEFTRFERLESTPDTGSTLACLGIALCGLLGLRRRIEATARPTS